MNVARRSRCLLPLLAATALASPALAQEAAVPAQAGAEPLPEEEETPMIVVTAPTSRGTVIGNIPPELTFDEADVASYGAGSIEELLDAISPQTGSARGRGGGGRPVVLLNGQRISGFREIRDLPPEAIERVEVFPEELALRYGFRPDQRVVNFVLKPDFASVSAEVEHGNSTAGDYGQGEIEATLTRIGASGRLNVDVEYERSGNLLESERGIVQSQPDDLGLADNGDFRTLIPSGDTVELNASYNRRLGDTISATLSGEYTHADTTALLGLPGATFTVPASSPFARNPAGESFFRLFPGAGPLVREGATREGELGLTVNGQLGQWRWSLTGNYARSQNTTTTDRAPDYSALVAAVAAGDPATDPFSPGLAGGLAFTGERARSVSRNADANATISGSPFALPAGAVSLSATSGYEWRAIDSETVRGGATVAAADLGRSRVFARANVDLPIASRREGVLDAIGDLSLNANAGYADVSDFGGLVEYGYGLNWEPVEGLRLVASVIGEEAAPSVQQLGDPVIVTPNVSVYDFATGDAVLVDRITGGNPLLLAEDRRDFKLSVNYAPGDSRNLRFTAEYIRNRSENVASSFPLLTPEIEAAFPDRVTRDASGTLIAIDARPVSFAEVRSERIRYGVNLSGEIGGDDEEEEGEGRRGRRGESRGGGGGRRGAFFGRGRGGGGGRWNLSAYHTWRLEETVLIRPGVPELDLLGGSATGSSPTARHSVELEGGVFMGGVGLRVSGAYEGAARIAGSGLPGSSDLFFGELFTLNLRAFVNLDQQRGLVEAIPFLAGSRLSLRVDNLFGGIRRVTDDTGLVPLSYQPGYLDPRGRYVELSFRKRF